MVAQAIRCECFSRVTKSGFLVSHIVGISHLISILFILHEPFIFVKPLNEYFFLNREDPDEMLHFIRVFTVCKGKLSSDKRIQYIFENYNLSTA